MDLTLAICVYNAEKYLEETLKSVLAQSFQDFYLLIVNDASTDNSMEVIDRFFTENPRQYKLVNLTENRGICFGRQTALKYSKTSHILFVDSDDILKPDLVEKLWNKAKSDENIIAVTCYSEFINSKGKKTGGGTFLGVKSKEEFDEKAKKGKLFFMPIHTLMNKEYALKAGGFVSDGFPDGKPRYQDFCEELDLWTRMSDFYNEGKYFATVPEILYQYRKSDGLSSNHFNMILKMRYTKNNVRRRRMGLSNMTFIEFYDSLSDKYLLNLKKEAKSAELLRNGVMSLKNNQLWGGGIANFPISTSQSLIFV